METTLTKADLRQFTGSENWYRHGLNRNILYTDGVRFVAERAGAFWLLDTIVLAQIVESKIRREGFQVWTLTVRQGEASKTSGAAILTCGDGRGNDVYRQTIDFTDFPLPDITLWLTDRTLLLPSEY